jgi:MFS family permease
MYGPCDRRPADVTARPIAAEVVVRGGAASERATALGFRWRYVATATLGNALEFYDFMIYAFFAIQIGQVFFPTQARYGSLMLSLATFGVGFITRPIGGFLIGRYADRIGRRAAMRLSYLMMGGSMIALAVIPSYAAIGLAAPALVVATRLVQGFSVGGAVGPNVAYLMESAPPQRRGFAVSWQSASQFLAATLAGVVGIALTTLLSQVALGAYGWRIAFLLGALTVPVGAWLLHGIPETLQASEGGTPQTTLCAARRSARVIAIGLIVLSTGPIIAYGFYYVATFAQDTLRLSPRESFSLSTIGNMGGAAAILLGGWLSDRVGRRPVMIWANLAHLALLYPTALWMIHACSTVAILAYLAGGCIGMMSFGVFTSALSESLPKNIRGAGFSLIYAVTVAVFGGTCQFVMTWLIHATGDPLAPTWYLLAATVVAQAAFMMFPESAPVRLSPPAAQTSVRGTGRHRAS